MVFAVVKQEIHPPPHLYDSACNTESYSLRNVDSSVQCDIYPKLEKVYTIKSMRILLILLFFLDMRTSQGHVPTISYQATRLVNSTSRN